MPARSSACQSGFETSAVNTNINGVSVSPLNELVHLISAAGLQYRDELARNGIPAWLGGRDVAARL